MSMQGLTAEMIAQPEDRWSASTQVHRQSWTQQVLAAAKRLGISELDVRNMTPGTLLRVQEERVVGGCLEWVDVVSPVDFTPTWQHEVRLLIRGLPEDHLVVVDVDFWLVSVKHVGAGPILRQLSEPLRLANFAAIRRKANIYRQSLVKKYVLTQRDGDSNMQGWASINGFSSVMQPYWHIYDVEHARRERRGSVCRRVLMK